VSVRSWGNYPKVEHAAVLAQPWRHLALPRVEGTLLPGGLARSYGDSCLNEGGTLLTTGRLDHLIDFDRETGVLRCEAGVSLAAILELAVPAGWFLPVVPGTALVTVGGAIANDVHGKNHHAAGSFGRHVRSLELLRSDGARLACSPTENAALFRATVGGLGLTGLVTWAELQLRAILSAAFDVETIRMENLAHFFELSREPGSDPNQEEPGSDPSEYSVAWIDALAKGGDIGRGVFMRANHAAEGAGVGAAGPKARLAVPFDFPAAALNRHSVGLFNALYRARASSQWRKSREPYGKYLFPLDGIARWNRMYGKPGFLQHQSVVPRGHAPAKLTEMLTAIAQSGDASFLTVLKVFGDQPRAGLLSFARPGVTLALDLPMRGEETLELLDRLDAMVRDAGGAIYPAKDARMSPETFRASFPNLAEFEPHVDPAFSSSFWRRVMR
jgi:FAD/FMN-containing dehydrogenase